MYDNCAGTGGFLVSAMRLMIKKAKGDKTREKSIKQKQLIGTEFQPNIYTLVVSNMFIHQDGKINIQSGDCFDEKIIKEIKKEKQTLDY